MDKHMRDSLDHWLTTPPDEMMADNYPDDECIHEFVSWHGSRGECQDCGKTISSVN